MDNLRKLTPVILLTSILVFIFTMPSRSIARTEIVFTINTNQDSHDTSPGDGNCTANTGRCSLRAAIEETNALLGRDTIFLPSDTYHLSLGELNITDDVDIVGSEINDTIISGENTNRIFRVDRSGGHDQFKVNLRKLTIENGNTSNDGGGVWNDEMMTIDGCKFRNNSAVGNGGGIYNTFGNISIKDSVVTNNHVTNAAYLGGGGGIYNSYGEVTILNTSVVSNTGTSTYVFGGGGVTNSNGQVTLIDSDVNNNSASAQGDTNGAMGGGILSVNGALILYNTNVNNNSAIAHGWMGGATGGGINLFLGEALLDHSTINGNSSSTNGGGLTNVSGVVNITSSLILNNTSSVGGGIENEGTSSILTIFRSIIQDNSAIYQGGGVYHFYGEILLNESTVSNNHASGSGSGFLIHSSGILTITNTTLSGNGIFSLGNVSISHTTITDTLSVDRIHVESGTMNIRNSILATPCSGIIYSYGFNLISNPGVCSIAPLPNDITSQDPRLTPLADHGGDTYTHALLNNSPAIDNGTCTNLNGIPINTDQRGASRRNICDIGAYEYGGTIALLSTSINPALFGETVTFTTTIIKGETIPITGTVNLIDESGLLGLVPINGTSQAVFIMANLPIGLHTIQASYSGNRDYAPSISNTISQTIWLPTFLPTIFR
jgi:hypothetical protein